MLVYLVSAAAAIAAVTAARGVASRRLARAALWVIAFLALFLPAALRFDLGVDYSATMDEDGYLGYYQLFLAYAHDAPPADGDVGFYALIRLIGLFTNDPQWLFVALSALTYALLLRALGRLSESPALSVALFLLAGMYFESLNIQKQWLAIACALNGLAWVGRRPGGDGRRSFWRFALWVGAGALFHSGVLVWLVAWPLMRVRMSPRRAVALLLALVLVAFAGRLALASLVAPTRFGAYFDPSSGVYAGPHVRPHYVVAVTLTWAGALWALGRREGEADEGDAPRAKTVRGGLVWDAWASALAVALTTSLALFVSGAFLPLISDRLASCFLPSLLLLAPHALACVGDGRRRRAFMVALLVGWAALTFAVVVAAGRYGVVPYRSVLDAHAALPAAR